MGQGNPPERGKDVGSSPSAVIWGALEPNFQVIKLWQGLEKVGGGGQGEEFQTLGWWGVAEGVQRSSGMWPGVGWWWRPTGWDGAVGRGQEGDGRGPTAMGWSSGIRPGAELGGVGRGGPGANPG